MEKKHLTRGGVAYDLSVSPYTQEITYKDEELVFHFSSQYYKDNFLDRLGANRDAINESLTKRFGFSIINNKLCDIKLYQKIEKRGFLIKNSREEFKCLNTIKLDGTMLIQRN